MKDRFEVTWSALREGQTIPTVGVREFDYEGDAISLANALVNNKSIIRVNVHRYTKSHLWNWEREQS